MSVPEWIQNVLSSFESRTDGFQEIEIGETLAAVRKSHGELSGDDWKGFLAEASAFLFGERRDQDSVWNTYFAPSFSAKNRDDTEYHSPDIKQLDAAVVAHWEDRAKTCRHPVMRARYADLVWDLKRKITAEKPNVEFARIAVDAYFDSAYKKLYPMDVVGIDWLGRALDLSRSINDSERIKRVVDFMFEFYDRIAQTKFVGTWLFLFDNLYDEKIATPEQEARITANLEEMLAKMTDAKPLDTGVYATLDPWGAEAAAQRLMRHYRRLNDKPNVERVLKAYGGAFEHMAREANPMVAIAWLSPVVEQYEQEGLKLEAEKLQLLAGEKGKNIRSDLKTVSVSVEIKEGDIDTLMTNLLGSGLLNTSLIRVAECFIPRVNDARELLDRLRTDAPFQSLIPIIVVESDGFPSAKIGSMEEDEEGRLHRQLAQNIGFYQPFLGHALTKLRETYAPTAEDILDFLCESPLFERGRCELILDGLSAYEHGDFIKAIHVLVPQVELTLRNFLPRLNISPRKTVSRHPGITDAKNMNDVLSDSRVRKQLTENLWRYLTVVYVDRRGLNLRNDLAHGLVPYEGFKRHIADRVVHTLLALSLMRTPAPTPGGQ